MQYLQAGQTPSRMRDPQRVNPGAKRRVSWAVRTSAYLARSSHVLVCRSAFGLLFNSPGMSICDQSYRKPPSLLVSFAKPTSSLRWGVDPNKGWLGCPKGLHRTFGTGSLFFASSRIVLICSLNHFNTCSSCVSWASRASRPLLPSCIMDLRPFGTSQKQPLPPTWDSQGHRRVYRKSQGHQYKATNQAHPSARHSCSRTCWRSCSWWTKLAFGRDRVVGEEVPIL